MATPSLSFGDIHVLHPEHYSNNGYPHDAWTQMRREDPVYWWDKTEGLPFWPRRISLDRPVPGIERRLYSANLTIGDHVREL